MNTEEQNELRDLANDLAYQAILFSPLWKHCNEDEVAERFAAVLLSNLSNSVEDELATVFPEDYRSSKEVSDDEEPHYPSATCPFCGRKTTRDPIYSDLCSKCCRADSE